jgi:hypothetical protein
MHELDALGNLLGTLTKIVAGYVLLGLLCATIVEVISGMLNFRGRFLASVLDDLLRTEKGSLRKRFYEHPLIQPLRRNLLRLPDYLPPRLFSIVLVDILIEPDSQDPSRDNNIQTLRAKLSSRRSSNLHEAIFPLIEISKNDLDILRHNLELWFNFAMDEVSGAYRRRVQNMVLLVASVIIVGCNIDSIAIFNSMRTQDILNTILAEEIKKQPHEESGDALLAKVRALNPLPIGWNERQLTVQGGVIMALGWLATLIFTYVASSAVFDLLGRFVNIRSASRRPS